MRNDGLLELNAVVAVATHRSFRAAAADLGISASALSRAIAGAEARMGVRLFNRTTRSVSLSEAGEQFLARVRPALSEISEAMDAANAFRDTPAGTLRINSSEGASRLILKPVFLEFLKRYPDMKLDIVSEGRLVDIVAEGFDAGIRLADSVPQDMIAVPLGPDQEMAIVAAPGYFRRRKRPRAPADLLGHDCVRMRLPSGKLYRWEFEKQGEEIEIDVPGRLTLDNANLIVEAALAGAGLACAGYSLAKPYIDKGKLVRVLEDWTPAFPGLCLYYPGRRHVPAGLRALVGVIRERGV